MKAKNPLYVVKQDHVEEAKNLLDLFIKKFNLAPAIEMLNTVLKLMLSQVTSYPAFAVVKAWFDMIVEKITSLVTKTGLAKA